MTEFIFSWGDIMYFFKLPFSRGLEDITSKNVLGGRFLKAVLQFEMMDIAKPP